MIQVKASSPRLKHRCVLKRHRDQAGSHQLHLVSSHLSYVPAEQQKGTIPKTLKYHSVLQHRQWHLQRRPDAHLLQPLRFLAKWLSQADYRGRLYLAPRQQQAAPLHYQQRQIPLKRSGQVIIGLD